jgi:hypothetical protein
MGFGGSQFWTTGPEITSLQVLSNLPPTVVVPLLDQEDEAPALGGTGEPNQTGSRQEKLVPLVPLPDLPEPSIRQASADPPAEQSEKSGPIVEEPVLVEARMENPTEDEKPAPPPVTVAPPPAIRNDKINKIEPAVAAVKEPADKEMRNSSNPDFVNDVAEVNVKMTIENIRTQSQVLKEMEDAGEIQILGGMYDISTGAVHFYE